MNEGDVLFSAADRELAMTRPQVTSHSLHIWSPFNMRQDVGICLHLYAESFLLELQSVLEVQVM